MSNKTTSQRVERVRVSIGTAAVLSLFHLHSDAEPTTAYLMTYTSTSCTANCAFCPQARESTSNRKLLSRVVWPDYPLETVVEGLTAKVKEGRFHRICIQSLNYPDFFQDISEIASAILSKVRIPISISSPPLPWKEMQRLKQLGVDRIGLPLDASTPAIFDQIKGSKVRGPYRWESHLKALKEALDVFGSNRVSTHIIVGLGETERDTVLLIQELHDMGVSPSLFAFTPIRGTRLDNLKQPNISQYRRVQLARYLIMHEASSAQLMKFNDKGRITDFGVHSDITGRLVALGTPFMTAGCPDCNRPFYTERPRGPIYNYPRHLGENEKRKVLDELQL